MRTFFIGRDAENDIVLNNNMVSRKHAQLTVSENGQVMIKDLGSSNGVFVNGNRVSESLLKTGDVVKCATIFLDWAEYISEKSGQRSPGAQMANISTASAANEHDAFGLGTVFKYLTTKINDIGDLFTAEWDKTTSILFLMGLPLLVSIFILYNLNSAYHTGRGLFISGFLLLIILFVIAPFLTMLTLSKGKNVSLQNTLLGASIYSFLQFGIIFSSLAFSWVISNNYDVVRGPMALKLIVLLMLISIIIIYINIFVASIIFIYKYFLSIGRSKSVSIYLVATTYLINLFIIIALAIFILGFLSEDMPRRSMFNF